MNDEIFSIIGKVSILIIAIVLLVLMICLLLIWVEAQYQMIKDRLERVKKNSYGDYWFALTMSTFIVSIIIIMIIVTIIEVLF